MPKKTKKSKNPKKATKPRTRKSTKRALNPEDVFRLKEATQPALAADGTVAFVVVTCDEAADEVRSAIWSVRPGQEPTQLTRGTVDYLPKWSPDNTQLGFLRRPADGSPQVWLLPARGGEARKLTDLPLGASNLEWSPDGTKLAVLAPVDLDGIPDDDEEKQRRQSAPRVITSGAYKADGTGLFGNKRVHLFVVDAETGEAKDLLEDDVNALTPAWSPDGNRIAYAASTDDRAVSGRSHLFVINASGGRPQEVVNWDGTAVCPLFSKDGKTLAFVGAPEPGPGHSRLYATSPNNGEPTQLAPDFDRNMMIGGPAYPGAPPRFLPDGRILFCARDRGCTHAYELRDGVVTKIVGGDDRVVSGLSDNSGKIACIVTTQDAPGEVFLASDDGTDEQQLTDLNRDVLKDVKLHRCEPRTFTAPDGTEIHGWVMRGTSRTKGPQPLLVDIHGGPHNAWSPTFDAVHLYHEMLAHKGWSILRLNPRGSDGYGEKFMTGVVGGWGIYDEQDFTSAIEALVEDSVADPERLAVCGYSYGGFMTNWLTAKTDLFKAAMSGGTVSDLQSIYGTSDFGFWMGVYEHGGELHEARDRFAASSPLSFVEHVTTPTLILHGENDDRCPVGQAEQWFISLQRLGVESEFVRYPGGSHLFILNGRPSHRVDYSQRIFDWMTKHIR